MSPIRLGALGCSAIARRRALPAAANVPELITTAVASRTREKAEQFAAEFGATATDYESLVSDQNIDAIYLSLPNSLHYEWTLRALEAGKHVLCEKPLTGHAAATRELTELAASKDLVLRENFAFLHHPVHDSVRRLLDQGRIGPLRTFTATFGIPPLPGEDIRYSAELGGGALLDVGVYPLRAALLLLGPSLSLAGATLRMDTQSNVDVAGNVLLTADSGVFASLEFGFEHSYRSRYALWGGAGWLGLDRAFTPPPQHQPVLRIEEQDHAEEIVLPPAHQFRTSLASFATAVQQRTQDDQGTQDEQRWLAGADALAALVDEVREHAVRVEAG